MRQFILLRNKLVTSFLLWTLALVGVLFFAPQNQALAVNPSIINFQGKVVSNASGSVGTNVTDGSYSFIFRLYDQSSPTTTGTCSGNSHCWWEETRTLTVTSGVFQVGLGDVANGGCSFSAACNSSHSGINWNTNNALYLTMQFNSDAAGFMTPAIALTSVPYAFNADNLGGISASGFIQNTSSPQSANFNITGSGTIGTSLQAPLLVTAAATDLDLQPTTGIVALNKASTSNELRVYENAVSPSNYASITATSNTATFKSNTGTTQIGNGVGAITLNAGTSSAVNITGHANSTWQTDTGGSLTIQSGSSLSLLSDTSTAISLDSGTTGNVTVGTGANAKAISEGNTQTGTTFTLEAGTASTAIQIGNGTTAHGIQIGAGGAAAGNAQTIIIGSASTSTASKVTLQGGDLTTTNNNSGIIIGGGFSTSSTNAVPFTLDSSSTFTETTNTCTASVNGGTLYYNSTSNSVRGCINGAWEDMVSTGSLGLQLFGVVPDTGTQPGDLAGVTGLANGPCKVSVGTNTTTVSWTGCVAFSGGRKVIVTAGTSAVTTTNNNFQHLCLNGTNNQPTLSASGTEIANLGTVSFSSVTAPILCLADIKTSNSAITDIYETITYTTTTKEFATVITNAAALGHLVIQGTTTPGAVTPGTTLQGGSIVGVVVASSGATSTSVVNAVVAINGPAWVKAITETGNAVGNTVQATATTGYAGAFSAPVTTNVYSVLGLARTAWTGSTTCTANGLVCSGSVLTNVSPR